MKVITILSGIICFLSNPIYCLGQNDTIFFAGIYIKIGMPKDKVISQLEKYHRLEAGEAKDQASWMIFEKTGPPHTFSGSISFKNGEVDSFSKNWGSFDVTKMEKAFPSLFSVLNNIHKDGKDNAHITTENIIQPNLIIDKIYISYINSSKKVIILIVETGTGAPSVTIQETLGFK